MKPSLREPRPRHGLARWRDVLAELGQLAGTEISIDGHTALATDDGLRFVPGGAGSSAAPFALSLAPGGSQLRINPGIIRGSALRAIPRLNGQNIYSSTRLLNVVHGFVVYVAVKYEPIAVESVALVGAPMVETPFFACLGVRVIDAAVGLSSTLAGADALPEEESAAWNGQTGGVREGLAVCEIGRGDYNAQNQLVAVQTRPPGHLYFGDVGLHVIERYEALADPAGWNEYRKTLT